jgi:hypothetical protein
MNAPMHFIVRRKGFEGRGYWTKEASRFGVEGASASHEQVLAFAQERDETVARAGEREPLIYLTDSLHQLLELRRSLATPLKAFADRAVAEAYRDRLERRARALEAEEGVSGGSYTIVEMDVPC